MVSERMAKFVPPYQHQANEQLFVNQKTDIHNYVVFDPAPSFLTQTPLGTPQVSTDERRIQETSPRNVTQSWTDEQLKINDVSHVTDEMGIQGKRIGLGEFIYRLANGDYNLTMSKVSIMGLVLGLLFLGFLFFIIGFLAAVTTLSSSSPHDSQSAWQASNAPAEQGRGGGGKLGHIAKDIGGKYAQKEIGHQLGPLNQVLQGSAAIVPKPLQPFARYGVGRARAGTGGALRQVNPFAHHQRRRERVPEMAQQPPATPQPAQAVVQQHYPAQYPQGYAPPSSGYPPAPQGGYRPPMPMSQGASVGMEGYPQGYAPTPQQPMIMQQTPYPSNPPPQATGMPMGMMAPQPAMYPQQPAPQQVMQAPAYPMVPQGGYYQ